MQRQKLSEWFLISCVIKNFRGTISLHKLTSLWDFEPFFFTFRIIKKALDKIASIKALRNDRRIGEINIFSLFTSSPKASFKTKKTQCGHLLSEKLMRMIETVQKFYECGQIWNPINLLKEK